MLSVAEIIDQLTDIKEVTLLYSAPQRSQEPLVRTEISKMSHRQKQMVATLGSGDPGREIEGPMAIVILGGLATSTILNLLVLPTLALRYGKFEPRQPR